MKTFKYSIKNMGTEVNSIPYELSSQKTDKSESGVRKWIKKQYPNSWDVKVEEI